MTDAIIETAARALKDSLGSTLLPKTYQELAEIAVAAVTPLIRAQVLEEAAKAMEAKEYSTFVPKQIAAAIRALKPARPSPSDASA